MAGRVQEAKGKVQEAAGELTGDARLEHRGRLNQVAGVAKRVGSRVFDALTDAMAFVIDRLARATKRSGRPA